MKNHCEINLPDGYEKVKTINAKDTKLSVLLNLIAILVAVGITLGAYFLFKPINFSFDILHLALFALCMFGYIILHELVHGLVYKIFTRQKLTFGITLTVAYCGVPDVYVYRKPSLYALLAPFVTFSIIFGVLIIFLPLALDKLIFAFLLGLHIGGCSGDIYVTILLLFKYRKKDTLIKDIGPIQYFYVKNK